MSNTEFYIDSTQERIIREDERGVAFLDDFDISELKLLIYSDYPFAGKRLDLIYDTEKEKVIRFLNCNCREKDNVPDLTKEGWNLEFVACPLRGGFCPDEGVICKPKRRLEISSRESEIVKGVVAGLNIHQIADMLFISPRTVESHKKNIYRKIRVNNAAQLSRWAHKNQIV